MATAISGSAAQPAALSAAPIPTFSFNVENNPNAEVLLPSIRMAGYSLESAIGDVVDNPLDAEATVVLVDISKGVDGWSIEVADDGTGMDMVTLDQMMRLGSRADHNLASDLGRFGLGSTTASLSLGRVQHVITSYEAGHFASAATDLDVIIKERSFVKHLADASAEEAEIFRAAFTRHNFAVPDHGTLVRILRADRVGRKEIGPAVEAIKKYIGNTYRYFIWAGRRFLVNGEEVQAIDPLDRTNPETTMLIDDAFDYTYPKGHEREGTVERIGMILAQLPDWGGAEANKLHGMTLDRQGLYVLRNRREIAHAQTYGLWTRHQELSLFRGELLFPASMDDVLGVNFLKSSWNLEPTQSLRDKLNEAVSPYMRQARNRSRQWRGKENLSETVPHEEAAKVISQRAALLRKPAAKAEKRQSGDGEGSRTRAETGRSRQPHAIRAKDALANAAEFAVADLGLTAPMFQADLIGRKLKITYNSAHPFYSRFLLDNRDNRSVVAGIDYLVYSLASAEMLAFGEETYQFIETMRENMSFNLRQLLST